MSLPFITAMASLAMAVASGTARAADLGRVRPEKPAPVGAYQGGGRTGGDTVADAVVIPGLPYEDTGNTCGFANDYDEVCPYGGSTAPDVVYRYTPTFDTVIDIDLCASGYDTKVYVWEDAPGSTVACNDDGCGYDTFQSSIHSLALESGHVYYFVIDGYGAGCGPYHFSLVQAPPPCVVDCPPGALVESEPPCQDGYDDEFNGGCQTSGWTPIPVQAGGCATLCGKSCTYTSNGLSYRDTDWFAVSATGGPVSVTGRAEFPLQLILIYSTDCAALQYQYATVFPCETAQLEYDAPAGQELWIWVGATQFSGIPESDYVLNVCGILGSPPGLGACCDVTGCWVCPEATCTGTWLGPGTVCEPSPCTATAGACCLDDGTCLALSQVGCAQQGGAWGGHVACQPNPCEQPTPARVSSWGRIKAAYR
jgi:hypothetical protein